MIEKKGKKHCRNTFEVVECVTQHFKYSHIERITEGFVVEVKTRTRLQRK